MQTFDLRVPGQPAPIKVNGQWQLLYELHLDNYAAEPLQPKQLRVLDADNGQVLRDYDETALRAMLGGPGLSGKQGDATIAPGAHAVIYLNLSFDDAPAALHLTHQLSATRDNGGTPLQAQGGTLSLQPWPAPVTFSPPLRDGYWVAIYDSSWPRGHRRTLYAVNGAVHVPGRYAIDWIKVDAQGRYTKGDPTDKNHWLGYGAEVLAVADGKIAAAMDGMPEPAKVDPGKPTRVPLQDASGNYVSLDLGGGRYVFYEHLKTGSITVKTGQAVHRGDVIGRLGYTGETTGPHLHMHVADANVPLDAEGVPYALDQFGWMGSYASIADFGGEKKWLPSASAVVRRGELPAPLSVLSFTPPYVFKEVSAKTKSP
ncbi:M23 family metallopeptidase [Dyella sp. 2RAB6]|uniref:M23 family metallopeptidase n=1 Tax=Dyella sp. 2RAB6 TaxID=3232992 RepID=UPI003F912AF9